MGCAPRNRLYYRPLLADIHDVVTAWEQKLTMWRRREVLLTIILAGVMAAGCGLVIRLSARFEDPAYSPGYANNSAAVASALEMHDAIVAHDPAGHITRVVAQSASFSDADIVLLSRLTNLQSVLIVESPVTDDGVAQLGALTQLQSVHLIDTQVTEAGRRALQAALPYADVQVLRTASGAR